MQRRQKWPPCVGGWRRCESGGRLVSIAGEISMPVTEHSDQILAGSWPSQGEMVWSGYSKALTAASHSLFEQLQVQHDIQSLLAGQSGAFIDAARQLVMGRQYALMNRIAAYRNLADKAHWAANAVHETKADLVEIVDKAEEDIKAAREAAEQAKIVFAAVPGAAAQIEAQLATDISSIVSTAKADAVLRDSEGAATVTGLVTDINTWKQPYANFMTPQGETPTAGAPQAPAQPAPAEPSGGTQPADYMSGHPDGIGLADPVQNPNGAAPKAASPSGGGAQQPAQSASGSDQSQKVEQTALRNDANQVPVKDAASSAAPKQPSVPSLPATPPAASSPASGAAGSSSAANPGSLVGQILKPMTSSPATSSAPAASSAGSPMSAAPVSAAAGGMPSGAGGAGAPHAGAPAAGGGAGNAGAGMAGGGGGPGAGVGGAGRAVGAGAAGAGIAEASARMGTGAISSAASAAGNAAGLGSQAAQSVSAPAAAAASAPAAAAGGRRVVRRWR